MMMIACGAEPNPATDDPYDFPDENRCISCDAEMNQEEQQVYTPAPRMVITPEELMFYPIGPDSAEFDPKEIRVINETGRLVFVTHAFIAEDEEGTVIEEGSADYFELEPFDRVPLEDGESTSVFVSFLGSERQRYAVLVVRTTDPVDHQLIVRLTGKYFLSP